MIAWVKKTWGLRGWFAAIFMNWRNTSVGRIRLWQHRRAGFTIVRIASSDDRYKRLVQIDSKVVANQGGQLRVMLMSRLKKEVEDWLNANGSETISFMAREDEILLLFKNPDDAVAFKIRWW